MQDIREKIQQIKKELEYVEKSSCFMYDYKLICSLLDKLKVKEIKLTKEDVEKNNSVYLVNYSEDGKYITIKKENDI